MEKSDGWLWNRMNTRRLELLQLECVRDLDEIETSELRRLGWLMNHLPSEWPEDAVSFLFEEETTRREEFHPMRVPSPLWEEDTAPH